MPARCAVTGRASRRPSGRQRLWTAAGLVLAVVGPAAGSARGAEAAPQPLRIAAVVTTYLHNSHADVIVSRLFETSTLDGKGRTPRLKLVSLYTDQVADKDKSRALAERHGFAVYDTIAGALTLGTDRLAVDGVLLIAEHGNYPTTEKGQIFYPKRRFFEETVAVFERSGRVVPVFCDKHLGVDWEEGKWIYERARALKIPFMAGSTVPLAWRSPPVDVARGEKLTQLFALNYGPLAGYGYHSLEFVQCLVDRRAGGPVGVRSVQCLTGPAVWEAGKQSVYDPALLDALVAGLKTRPLPAGQKLEAAVREPVLFVINYRDGLRVCVLTGNDAVVEWGAAWRKADGSIVATTVWTQEARPLYHFSFLVDAIEQFMHTRKSPWPIERTLLVTGILDALLTSQHAGGQVVETPYLDFTYPVDWTWQEPPTPPPGRPLPEQ